eukprot:Gregarina_sp_Poly_1__6948@NODE_377_length_9088_cov_94_889924_g310_i0_p4_GENE_NODE_377_length_9088_cov_94_889924_g310_i0NODE_377_length_9088_cov_94_889924_g310_i0_p4_ORF_typecomplete_len186_score21_29Sds3/PF08598_11/0_067MCPVI/PF02993_14/2_1MCPVI/PF02993_14/1_9e03_NODE_377_length_9088_cov_94_889924_g310_i047085265
MLRAVAAQNRDRRLEQERRQHRITDSHPLYGRPVHPPPPMYAPINVMAYPPGAVPMQMGQPVAFVPGSPQPVPAPATLQPPPPQTNQRTGLLQQTTRTAENVARKARNQLERLRAPKVIEVNVYAPGGYPYPPPAGYPPQGPAYTQAPNNPNWGQFPPPPPPQHPPPPQLGYPVFVAQNASPGYY